MQADHFAYCDEDEWIYSLPELISTRRPNITQIASAPARGIFYYTIPLRVRTAHLDSPKSACYVNSIIFLDDSAMIVSYVKHDCTNASHVRAYDAGLISRVLDACAGRDQLLVEWASGYVNSISPITDLDASIFDSMVSV